MVTEEDWYEVHLFPFSEDSIRVTKATQLLI